MSRLAIFIDGGYYNALAERHYRIRIDFLKFTDEIKRIVSTRTPDTIDVLRTLYYDCPPYQSQSPTQAERQRYGQKIAFFHYLETLPRVQVRQGRLAYRGMDSHGNPIFQQKRVDLLLGLDFADLSTKHQVTHVALVAGDSDYCPAIEFAKNEAVSVWLFHGPRVSPLTGEGTYARDLWTHADERYEMDQAFMDRVKRT